MQTPPNLKQMLSESGSFPPAKKKAKVGKVKPTQGPKAGPPMGGGGNSNYGAMFGK